MSYITAINDDVLRHREIKVEGNGRIIAVVRTLLLIEKVGLMNAVHQRLKPDDKHEQTSRICKIEEKELNQPLTKKSLKISEEVPISV